MENFTIELLGDEVPVRELDRRLKKLWESNETLTRASLTNFAIYRESCSSLVENTELLREVTREHACRALVLAVDPVSEGPPSVRAWITAHCQVSAGGKKSICSEQIAFEIKGQAPNLVANTLFSYLDSDLPLTFWWQGEFSANWEPHLYTSIDRLVIDSVEWHNPIHCFGLVEKAWRNPASAFSVNDLTWTRVLRHRMALAAAFDEPGTLEHLAQVTEVEIDYGKGHKLAAKMFGAWLAHQAGWTLESGMPSEGSFLFRRRGGHITIRFQEEDSTRPVPHMELRSPLGFVKLVHEENSPYIHTRIGLPSGSFERLTPCPCGTPAELVVERLRRGCNTKLYFTLLRTVRAFLGEYE